MLSVQGRCHPNHARNESGQAEHEQDKQCGKGGHHILRAGVLFRFERVRQTHEGIKKIFFELLDHGCG